MSLLLQRACHAQRFAIVLLMFARGVPVRAQTAPAATPPTAFVFFQRTSGHVKLSTPEVFQRVVDEVQEYLKSNGIATITSTNVPPPDLQLPLYAVQELARESKAAYLLYVTVDRPFMKWVQVTVQCFDTTGHVIWQEQSSAGRELSGKAAARDAMQRLRQQLNKHLGQPGLLLAVSEPALPAPANTEAEVKSAGNAGNSLDAIRIPDGTPVHLLVAETVSSKTTTAGSALKLQVFGDVKVGDLVVIANKASALGTIQTAESAGRAWQAGKLLLKLNTVTLLNQQQQALRAWSAAKGRDTDAGFYWVDAITGTYGFALLALPFAPLQHGNQAFLYRGTVLEAAIDGDVLRPRATLEAAQPKPAEPVHGPASVTFYYPDVGRGFSVDIWCGEVKVGRLRRGGKFTLSLPAAKYALRLWNRGHPVVTLLEMQDGEEQYVSVKVYRRQTGTNIGWPPYLSVEPHDIGEAQSIDTTPAKSDHVQDIAKLDLAKLQAEPKARE